MSRTRPTYLYAIVSVSLVLFIVGFMGLTAIHGRKLITLFQEKVDVWLELKPELPREEIQRLVEEIRAQPFVKKETVAFVTKEQAMADMKEDLGEESMLEEMPNLLRDVVRFNVRSSFMDHDSLALWRDELRRDTAVADLYFEATNFGNVGKNLENLGWITAVLGILLIFAAVTLIHNTIRLALYSNRFLIKNQELVGASWQYISRPYLVRSLLNGLWSAAIAIAALIGVLAWSQRLLPDLRELEDLNGILMVFFGLVLLGILISGLSTYLVVNKFLRMRVDDLY